MRLLKLSLENWRGVDARDVEFSDGVTLIEGPNEIGKSTIVEAIRMLFNELDSSKKQTVKAIKPIDRDVGSHIEAEVKSGEYHFVYSKTFNKTAQTSLNVLEPKKRQVTGREAHEAVDQMLTETVDMALWEALLVDQGEKVALANIQDSAGLARALDDAAGSAATGSDDTDFYQAAQSEYERYFTLKAGKSKFAAEEIALDEARIAFESAQEALAEVEATALAHDRSAVEVLRIKAQLPKLKETADRYATSWQAVKSLKNTVDAKTKEFADAQAIHRAALDVQKNRSDLVADVSAGQTKVAEAEKILEPLQQAADRLKEQTKSARLVIEDLRRQVKTARTDFDLAHADEQHLQALESLAKEQARLKQLQTITKDKSSSLEVTGSTKITDQALEQLREAENRAAIARGTRNMAATTISIIAESKLVVEVDGKEIALGDSEVETRTVAAPLRVNLPGVAEIDVTPPQSAAELQREFDESEEARSRVLSQYDVSSLKDAVVANERRAEAQRDLDRLKTREKELLDGTSTAEIEQVVSTYHAETARYAEQRESTQNLPEVLAEASDRVSTRRSELVSRETALDKAQEKADALQNEYGNLDGQLRIAQQNLAGLKVALADKEERLKKLRSDDADAALAKRAAEAAANAEKLEREVETLNAKLSESSPDSVEALLNNAQSAWDRAKSDLIKEEQNLAVLKDRLQQAQADGRFEAMESAERVLEESQRKLESTRRRAEAIELLWNTLNDNRNSARKAYVRPLKDAIERLGKIVFGSGFEIEIGEDWTIITRTMNGTTLPFDYLSVGAREQLGILARLAAAQIVAKQGGVPLIIDDALGFSDPSRLETTGAAIAAAGKDTQIIILTCTPGRFAHVGSADVVRF
jgi:DNA repair exonuclease SbcCD ATPase subunit